MPLSEHEQRLLEQMERALYAEDPKFASSLRSNGERRTNRRRSAVGVIVALLGAGALVAGVAWAQVVVGVIGFVAMLLGSYLVVSGLGARAATPSESKGRGASPKVPSSGGFMDRLEDRWRRRQEGDQDL